MGITLKDIGNFAVGAIERDRELTRENLAIRADELAANRDFLIKQKQKKYDRELEEYYKEKEKFDSIQSANADFASGTIDARTYAAQVLPVTTSNWSQLPDKMKEKMVNNFNGKTVDYKLIGSEDEINKQAANIITQINSETSKAIKDAKGNSFLISKILGEKQKAEADLLKEVEDKIKATDAISLTEKNVNQENVGLTVKVGGSENSYKNFLNETNSNKFQDTWLSVRDKMGFNVNNGIAGLRFLSTTQIIGATDELSFKYDEKDSKIKGMNAPSIAHVNAMNQMFDDIKNNRDTMVQHYYTVSPLHGDISKTWNEEKIFQDMQRIIPDRSGNIKEDIKTGIGGNVRLTTVVPLSIIPIDAQFKNKETGDDITKLVLKAENNSMNKFILAKAKVLQDSGNFDDRTAQGLAELVYQKLYMGDEQYLNEYNKFKGNKISTKDTNLTGNNQKSEDSSKPDNLSKPLGEITGQNKIVPDKGIQSGDGKNILTWKQIEETGQVGELNAEEKAAYDKWKSTQEKPKIPFLKEDGSPKVFM